MRSFRKTTPATVPMRFDVPLEEIAIRSEMTEDQVRTIVLAEVWDNQPEGRGITAPSMPSITFAGRTSAG